MRWRGREREQEGERKKTKQARRRYCRLHFSDDSWASCLDFNDKNEKSKGKGCRRTGKIINRGLKTTAARTTAIIKNYKIPLENTLTFACYSFSPISLAVILCLLLITPFNCLSLFYAFSHLLPSPPHSSLYSYVHRILSTIHIQVAQIPRGGFTSRHLLVIENRPSTLLLDVSNIMTTP